VRLSPTCQSAEVNLRTAKIQLLQLLNDRTPVEQLDVVGTFDSKSHCNRWRNSARSRSMRVRICGRRRRLSTRPAPITNLPSQTARRIPSLGLTWDGILPSNQYLGSA